MFARPAALLLLTLLGLAACRDAPPAAEAAAADGAATVETQGIWRVAEVRRGDILDVVPALGTIKAAASVDVGAEVSGRIESILVDVNDAVTAGQTLAVFDQTPFLAAAAQARAQVDRALAEKARLQVQIEADEADLQRLERLGEAAAAADREQLAFRIAAQRAGLDASDADIRLAAAALDRANVALQNATIVSPIDGFVLERHVDPGQTVNSTMSTPLLFVVASDLDDVIIEAMIAETDVARIADGMEVRFHVEAYPNLTLQGTSRPMERSGRSEGRFVSFPVVVDAENPAGVLLPGMTASLEFVAAEARSEVLVPIEALYFRPSDYTPQILPSPLRLREIQANLPVPGDEQLLVAALDGFELGSLMRESKRRMFVLRDGAWAMQPVTLGAEDARSVAITSGLQEGDWVIIGELAADDAF